MSTVVRHLVDIITILINMLVQNIYVKSKNHLLVFKQFKYEYEYRIDLYQTEYVFVCLLWNIFF